MEPLEGEPLGGRKPSRGLSGVKQRVKRRDTCFLGIGGSGLSPHRRTDGIQGTRRQGKLLRPPAPVPAAFEGPGKENHSDLSEVCCPGRLKTAGGLT